MSTPLPYWTNLYAKKQIYMISPGLEIKYFFQGAQMHLQKLPKGVVYRNRYILGLPPEI